MQRTCTEYVTWQHIGRYDGIRPSNSGAIVRCRYSEDIHDQHVKKEAVHKRVSDLSYAPRSTKLGEAAKMTIITGATKGIARSCSRART